MFFDNKIPKQVKEALFALERWGFEAYIVGGCVRDLVLGENPQDYDIVTDADFHQITECFQGYRINEECKRLGIVRVTVIGMIIDVTTYAANNETYIGSLDEDLASRAFSMDAMAYNPDTGIIDPYGGVQSLEKEPPVINVVMRGKSETVFEKNPIRILKALSYVACKNYSIGTVTNKIILNSAGLLNGADKKQVREEFNKLILGRNIAYIMDEYRTVLAEVIPELTVMFGFRLYEKDQPFDLYTHTIKALSLSHPEIRTRLAVLFHNIGKPDCFSLDDSGVGHYYGHAQRGKILAECIMDRMGYDDFDIEAVSYAVCHHDDVLPPPGDRVQIKQLMRKAGADKLKLLLHLKIADCYAKSVQYTNKADLYKDILNVVISVIDAGECYTLSKLAVNRTDLLDSGAARTMQGAEKLINALLDAVITHPKMNEKKSLIKIAKANKID